MPRAGLRGPVFVGRSSRAGLCGPVFAGRSSRAGLCGPVFAGRSSRAGTKIAAVPDLAHHIASFARFAAARGERERDDADAMRELAAGRLELASGLELEWLGVAGYRLSFEGQTLYIDPYLSRVPLVSVIRRTPALADPALHERFLRTPGRVVGVLVGHTHFDHAIDVPAIARRYQCAAYGSSSLVQLMRLHGLAERVVEVQPGHPYELGPFVVTFVPSLHSKLLLGFAVPFDGELTCEHLDALAPSAYRCGQVWGIHIEVAGMTFYHQGSANLIDEALCHSGVDVFLAGIAGRSFTPDYWSGFCGGCNRGRSWRATSMTSSVRSTRGWGSRPTSTWLPCPTRSRGSVATSPSRRCRCWSRWGRSADRLARTSMLGRLLSADRPAQPPLAPAGSGARSSRSRSYGSSGSSGSSRSSRFWLASERDLRGLYYKHFGDRRKERQLFSTGSFFTTFATVRVITHAIRAERGPFRNITPGGRPSTT